MNLLFDIGNSRIKWAWGARAQMEVADTLAAALAELGRGNQCPARIAIAATAKDCIVAMLTEELAQRWPHAPIEIAHSQANFGDLKNSYVEPRRMGVDRWVAMIAARTTWAGEALVIDAGTALTCDRIDAAGAHVGGWIIPGLAMMRRALGGSTARVGDHDGVTPQRWGRDTQGAVLAGTHAALGAAVAAACGDVARHREHRIFITGGDRAILAEALEPWQAAVDRRPNLVIEGLATWLDAQETVAC